MPLDVCTPVFAIFHAPTRGSLIPRSNTFSGKAISAKTPALLLFLVSTIRPRFLLLPIFVVSIPPDDLHSFLDQCIHNWTGPFPLSTCFQIHGAWAADSSDRLHGEGPIRYRTAARLAARTAECLLRGLPPLSLYLDSSKATKDKILKGCGRRPDPLHHDACSR
jgi:hypothetical protein